mmetsp:Transcript_33503/g.52057  ORF Transcript_33503/g.52057 Transcript_33503/m.52057 type:complete len:101 (-) Transcript_33503:2047-2349(-)
MENQQLKSSLEKIIQDILLKLEIEISESLKYSLIEICYDIINKIISSSSSLCEEDSKNLLSEDHLIPVLINLGFGRYISEIKEEQIRTKKEELKLAKINN